MNYTLTQLKKLAQAENIKGRSKMNKAELCAALNLNCETLNKSSLKTDEGIFFDYCVKKIKQSIEKQEKFAYLRFFESKAMESLSLDQINNTYLCLSAHFFNKSTYTIIYENNCLGADLRIYDLRNYCNGIKHINHEHWVHSILSYFKDEIKKVPTNTTKINFDESIALPMGHTINADFFYYEVCERMFENFSEWTIRKNNDGSPYLCKTVFGR